MKRLEGIAKLTGAERYTDDIPSAATLWGMTVRSHIARGILRAVRFPPTVDWSEFIIVQARDIPGPNVVFLIEKDQPVLAEREIRHPGEPVVLLAHRDRALLRYAVTQVQLDVDPLPPSFDFRLAAPDLSKEMLQRSIDNVLKHLHINKGDVDRTLASAPIIVEGHYETGAQEHVYLENQAMIASVKDDVVTVQGSMQCPYYVLNALKHALNRDERHVRVIQAPTGGGFGGKEDYPSVIALHAALLSLKAGGHAVRMIYDRGEDMAATTKRHPSLVRHRTALAVDGRLLAQDIEVILDGGAYVTLSPVVLSRGMLHAAGPYFCENVRVHGRAVLTNTVPHGAFRGFGAPQTIFACERHMDRIAAHLGMDPAELRCINLLKDGQTTATGQVISGGVDRVRILDTALERSSFTAKKREHIAFNATSRHLRRGMGMATFWHGAGFTGSGEVYLSSVVHVAALPDSRIQVRTANTEIGQGTCTIFTQIVAHHLGVDPGRISIATPDTSVVPNSGPTVASRTAMVVGRLIERACDDLRSKLNLHADAKGDDVIAAIRLYYSRDPSRAELVGQAQYAPPAGVKWDDASYTGDAYGTFAWGAYIAEVEVDLRTAGVRVMSFHAHQEIGTVINELLARGQVQGGVVQAIGWALMEECIWRHGAMANAQLTNYIIPTSDDVPSITVSFEPGFYPYGAMGCKGIGELPMDGPAPAILNAVAAATGADPCEIPLTPERLLPLLMADEECAA